MHSKLFKRENNHRHVKEKNTGVVYDSPYKKAGRFCVLFAAKLQRNPKRLFCGPVLHNACTHMYESTDDRRSRRRRRCSTCVLRLLQLGCELLARKGCATQHEPQQTEDNATQRGTVRTRRFTYKKGTQNYASGLIHLLQRDRLPCT